MNINAKKTNYTLENAIQSSCFVLPLRKNFLILSQLICMSRTEIEIFTALEQKRLELRSLSPALPNI